MRLEVIQRCWDCPFIEPSGLTYHCGRDASQRPAAVSYRLSEDVPVPSWCPLIAESVCLTAVRDPED